MVELLFVVLIAITDIPATGSGQAFSVTAPPVDEQIVAQALLPMTEAIAAERARQAALPPATTDSEKLVRMGQLDQIARASSQTLDLANLSTSEANVARSRALGLEYAIDQENQATFKTIATPDRWFTAEEYGAEASRAAFFIVQHADEELWKVYVPLLEPLVGTGQINDAHYALMYDRLAVSEGRPQRYGSQYTCDGRQSKLAPLETDAASVDQARAAMGMISMADNAKRFERSNPCQLNPQ